jgi:hypothetical protein
MNSYYALSSQAKKVDGRHIGKFIFAGSANGSPDPSHSEEQVARDLRTWKTINASEARAHKLWHESQISDQYIAGNWEDVIPGRNIKVFETGNWFHSSEDSVRVIGYVWVDANSKCHFYKYKRSKKMRIKDF